MPAVTTRLGGNGPMQECQLCDSNSNRNVSNTCILALAHFVGLFKGCAPSGVGCKLGGLKTSLKKLKMLVLIHTPADLLARIRLIEVSKR